MKAIFLHSPTRHCTVNHLQRREVRTDGRHNEVRAEDGKQVAKHQTFICVSAPQVKLSDGYSMPPPAPKVALHPGSNRASETGDPP